MPPVLALVLTTGFVTWLFLRGEERRADISWALWLPLAWLFITGTRFVGQWIALGTWSGSQTSEDGSPLDAAVFGLLTLVGCLVLIQRRAEIGSIVRRNPWIVLLLVYGLVSLAWSDFPFVSLKRWIKALGNVVMALIVVTDANPRAAFLALVRRFGYLALPYSVMLIKYFPEYGRGFDSWTGAGFNQGVSLSKNGLGQLCVVIGITLFWRVQVLWRDSESLRRSSEWWVALGMLAMLAWLLFTSDSKTSQVALSIGVATMVVVNRVPAIRTRFTLWFVLVATLLIVADLAFDLRRNIIVALGRDPTLTDRTEIWADVIALQPNVLLGAGYEAFWLGERLQILWSTWLWQPNQAHSSYVEMYANGGLIGVGLLVCMLISAFRSAARDLANESQPEADWGRLRMALLLAIVFCSYTEALFKGVNSMWTVFYVIAWTVAYPALPVRRQQPNAPLQPATQRPHGFMRPRRVGSVGSHPRSQNRSTQ
jgi:exopolysaccharide production protein ExoQ